MNRSEKKLNHLFLRLEEGLLRLYRFLRLEKEYWDSTGFYLAESKFVHDLNFDFSLFAHFPPFLVVDF